MLGEELEASLSSGNQRHLFQESALVCLGSGLGLANPTLTSPNPPGLNADASRDSFLFFMDYKSSCPPPPAHTYRRGHIVGGGRGHMSDLLEEQLLSYSENAENEGEEVEYLEEEEELQVRRSFLSHLQVRARQAL